jgi:cobalt-zinc-cadmium efflux system protein
MAEKKTNNHRKSHRHQPISERNLLIATLLNFVITIVEIAGGILSNSLALLSDALHNMTDAFSTFIALIATRVGKRNATEKKTFGYKRIEILAAMLNAVILMVICFFLFREAWERLMNPKPIKSLIVILVAMIGLVANILAVTLLRKDSKKSLNIKAAYVHLIGDSLSSIVVIIAATAIQLYEIYWLDPAITFLIGIYLIRESYIILKNAINILMQSTPEHLNINKIKMKVESFPEVQNVHHLHAWNLSDREVHFEAHIELANDLHLSQVKIIQQKIEKLLKERFQIYHTTLQFEFDPNHNKDLLHQEIEEDDKNR